MRRFKLRRKKKKEETADEQPPEQEPQDASSVPPPPVAMPTADPTYKVILCGEYGVGKSSIFRRFLNDSFVPSDNSANHHRSAVGLDQYTRPFTVDSTPVKLTLWDTGGMERMSFIGGSYYRGAHAALLVYNTNNRDTFTILSQYFLDIAMNAETAKIFVCGNDGEAAGPGPVEDADMESFSKESEGIVSGMYQVSCISNTGLEHMFRDMARVLHAAAMDRLTLRRDIIQPGHTPGDVMATHAHEDDETNGRRKRCC